MRNFAFGRAETVAQAAVAAGLVADAMLATDGGAQSRDLRIVKAGGIDLMDLMKEGLLVPAEVTSLSGVAGLDAIAPTAEGGVSVGPMVTLARLESDAAIRERYPALAEAAGESASPQIRAVATIGGNLLQRPRCWYFRAAEFRCLRKGGGQCYAISGENQFHAIFDNRFCAIVHPSTSATALVALGAEIELTGADGGTRRVALEDFFIGPDRDVQRENDLRANELLTAVLLPPSSGLRMKHQKLAQKESFDWPLADAAVVLDLAASGAWCRRADAMAGSRGGGGAEREGHRRGYRRRGGPRRARRRDPAFRQRLQGAMFEALVKRTILAAAAF